MPKNNPYVVLQQVKDILDDLYIAERETMIAGYDFSLPALPGLTQARLPGIR